MWCSQAKLSNVRVSNRGWVFKSVDYKDTTYPEITRIRGFELEKLEQFSVAFDQPGLCLIQNVSL